MSRLDELTAAIREALARLLAQDRFELPFVGAALAALAELSELAEQSKGSEFVRPEIEAERRALMWLTDVRTHGGPLDRRFAATLIDTLAWFEQQQSEGSEAAADASVVAEVGPTDCPSCDGQGWYISPEHEPGCDGSCKGCPVPIQRECETCGGWGVVSALSDRREEAQEPALSEPEPNARHQSGLERASGSLEDAEQTASSESSARNSGSLSAGVAQPGEPPDVRADAEAIRAALVLGRRLAVRTEWAYADAALARLTARASHEAGAQKDLAVEGLQAERDELVRQLREAKLPSVEHVQTIFALAKANERAEDAERRVVLLQERERDHNSLIEAVLVDHHMASSRGKRAGQMVHSDCEICEWLASHPESASAVLDVDTRRETGGP